MLGKVKAMWERFTGVAAMRADRDVYVAFHNAAKAEIRILKDESDLLRRQRDAARDERDAARSVCDRLRVDLDRSRADREAQIQAKLNALRWVDNLNAELETARRTAALHRSLIAILRDVNRDLDERLNALESKPEVEATV